MRRLISIIGVVVTGAWLWKRRGSAKGPLEAVRSAVPQSVTERVQGVTEKATQAAHATLDKAQEAGGTAQGKAQEAVKGAAKAAQETVGKALPSHNQASEEENDESHGEKPQQQAQPSVHETVQEEIADVQKKGDSLRSNLEAPPEKADDSAKVSGISGAETVTSDEAKQQETLGETDASPRAATTGKEEAPRINRAAEVAERTSGEFIGNKHTRIFHPASTEHMPSEKNRIYFENEEEALAAGFQPAANEDFEAPQHDE